jgi:ABC-type branched-subunit amino acid transport system substrate-binding protein
VQSSVAMGQLGSAANGLLFSVSTPPGSNANLTAFDAAYKAKTGQDPAIEAWPGYNAVTFIAHALQKAGSTSGPAIAAALHQVQLDASNGNLYPGTLSFASNGVMTNQSWFWQQDQHGQLLYVYPSTLSQASLIPYG